MPAPRRPLRVKLILPALLEATAPGYRPIKYALFPPLGLAALAAYLDEGDEVTLVDEHVQQLVPSRRRPPSRSPRMGVREPLLER